MTDKELIEFAAKAAGYSFVTQGDEADSWIAWDGREPVDFNPLRNDADAFRLMVNLNMRINTDSFCHWGPVIDASSTWHTKKGLSGVHPVNKGDDALEATRRAIVQVAAEIGKNL